MDADLRTLERHSSDLRALATARLRQGDREGAARAWEAELRRLEAEQAATEEAINVRLLNSRLTRAADLDLPDLVRRKLDLLEERLQVVERLTELGWHFPRPI